MKLLSSYAVFTAALIATAFAHCHDETPLNDRYRPMHYNFFAFERLNGVQELTFSNISEMYTNVIELMQSVFTLKGDLGVRIHDNIPPHHHCFLPEYDEDRVSYMQNFTLTEDAERLSEDLQTLEKFALQLQRAIDFESEEHRNQYTHEMTNIQDRYLSIVDGLTNMTQPEVSDEGTPSAAANGGSFNEIPTIPTTEPTTPYEELFHQVDINVQPTTLPPPTELPECASTPLDDIFQYIIYYEFWQALHYLQMDLANAKQRYA